MATSTLERQTEVVADKARATASVQDAAANETKERVSGSGIRNEARAWDARAQID